MKVALVEDDEAIACLLRYNFEVAGWQVEHFETGYAALQGIGRASPDLVVLDWHLPGLSGIEILRQLRATPTTRLLPVVMLTGRCEPSDRKRALDSGADAFFSKPFSISDLLNDGTRRVRRMARVDDVASPQLPAFSTGCGR